MFGHVDRPHMTSPESANMTSLTDHSVESILGQGKVGDAAVSIFGIDACHVTVQTGSTTRRGDRHAGTMPSDDESRCRAAAKPRLELESPVLWRQFYGLCTEMVITKSGRLVMSLSLLL